MAPATEEKKKLEPKADIAEVGPCKLKVRVEVAAAKVHERIEDEYKKLAQSAELPGFRKGHAPRPILERKFGKALLDDLKFDLLTTSFEEVKETSKLEPLGEQTEDSEEITIELKRVVKLRHRRRKYRCRCNGAVVTACGPRKLVAGGRYSLDFSVWVATTKMTAIRRVAPWTTG